MNSPNLLKIETTDKCNSECVFCLHRKHAGHDMDFDLFKKIVDMFPDAQTVSPQFFGEPTMYLQLPEAIQYAKDAGKRVNFYTNGSFIYGNMVSVASAKPDHIIFSVEADNKELYEKIRVGLNWSRFLFNLDAMQEFCTDTTITIRMTICKENQNRIGEIKAFWQDKGFYVVAVPEAPIKRFKTDKYNNYKCDRPMRQLIVKWNGDVVFCCVDLWGKYVIGNVKNEGESIWMNKRFNELIKTINTEDAPTLCLTCGFRTR